MEQDLNSGFPEYEAIDREDLLRPRKFWARDGIGFLCGFVPRFPWRKTTAEADVFLSKPEANCAELSTHSDDQFCFKPNYTAAG
jgi:hypothetical protein